MADHHHIEGAGGTALCGARPPYEPLILAWDGATGAPILRPPCGDCMGLNSAAQAAGAEAPKSLIKPQPEPIERVVVSMTSVPARNGTLDLTLASLTAQTRPPDEIRLYIGPGCADNVGFGVIVQTVADRGPVTKLSAIADSAVPADALVITADDDITYHPNWLATLLRSCAEFPEEACGMAGWNVSNLLSDGIFERAVGRCDVIEGFAGVAYHKWFFGTDVLNPPESVRWVDDVWISAYLHRVGIGRRVVCKQQDQSWLMDITRSVGSGIHTRPDFADMNRRAAALFATEERQALLARRTAALRAVP